MKTILMFFLSAMLGTMACYVIAQSPSITNFSATPSHVDVHWAGGPGTYTASISSNLVEWNMQIETAGVRQVVLPVSNSTPFLRMEYIPVAETISYRLTFNATWSESTHPLNFPPNPHFSPLIGVTHNDQASFWEPGTLASAGTSQVAETGSTNQFNQEVQSAITAGHALSPMGMSGIVSPGNISITFTADRDFPLLTIITMLAPSPDWFVGLHDYPLIQSDAWIDDVTIPLFTYDAGTDSGGTYVSSNQDTQPPELVVQREDAHFAPGGTLTPVGIILIESLD